MKKNIISLFGIFLLLTLNLSLHSQPLVNSSVFSDPPSEPDGADSKYVPEGLSYQAIARDADGNIMSDVRIGIRIELLQGDSGDSPEYSETHHVRTDKSGQFSLVIGNGQIELGEFKSIQWEKGNKWLQLSVDINETGNFELMGKSQMLSVPYAMYAGSAGGIKSAGLRNGNADDWDDAANMGDIFNNNTGNVGVGTNTPKYKLHVKDNTIYPVNVDGDSGNSKFILFSEGGDKLGWFGPTASNIFKVKNVSNSYMNFETKGAFNFVVLNDANYPDMRAINFAFNNGWKDGVVRFYNERAYTGNNNVYDPSLDKIRVGIALHRTELAEERLEVRGGIKIGEAVSQTPANGGHIQYYQKDYQAWRLNSNTSQYEWVSLTEDADADPNNEIQTLVWDSISQKLFINDPSGNTTGTKVTLSGINGATGAQGSAGVQGATGSQGPSGADGQDGANGQDGLTSYVFQTEILAGDTNCPAGGTLITSGLDVDGNGQLTGIEILATEYICNGKDGAQGATGAIGIQGPTGALAAGQANQTLRYDANNGWEASSTILNDGYNAIINGSASIMGNADISDDLIVNGAIEGYSSLEVDGDFLVNTNKFTVTSATGNTHIGGDLNVSGQVVNFSNELNVNGATALNNKLKVLGSTTLYDELDLSQNKIINVQDPVNTQDAATKAYVDAADGINTTAISSLANDIAANTTSIVVNTTKIVGLQTEVDAIETGSGLNTDGSYSANANANFIATASSLNEADVILDAQMGINKTNISTNSSAITSNSGAISINTDSINANRLAISNEINRAMGTEAFIDNKVNINTTAISSLANDIAANVSDIAANTTSIGVNVTKIVGLQTEVDAIEAGSGLNTDGSYSANANANFIATASSLNEADVILDAQINTNKDNISVNITSIGVNATKIVGLQTEVDAVEAGSGLNADGTYSPDTLAHFISTASSLFEADHYLDTQIEANLSSIFANGMSMISNKTAINGANLNSDKLIKWDGSKLVSSIISDNGIEANVNGNAIISGALNVSGQVVNYGNTTMNGNVKIGGELDLLQNSIINVLDPIDPQDAATKLYVDASDAINASAILINGSRIDTNGFMVSFNSYDISANTSAINGNNLTTDKLTKWDGSKLVSSLISDNGLSETTISGNATITSNANISDDLFVNGNIEGYSDLDISGSASITGDFEVNTNKFKVSSVTGNTSIAGTLGVDGKTGIGDDFSVYPSGQLNSGTEIFEVDATNQVTNMNGTVVYVNTDLKVSGANNIIGGYTTIDNLTVGGTLNAGAVLNGYTAFFNADVTCQQNLTVMGTLSASNTSFSSDRRFKKNVNPLEGSLSKIIRVQGYSYNWKKEEFENKHFNDKKQYGVIAQELEQLYPELIHEDKEGYKSVNYIGLIPIMIEGMKEQQKLIEQLQKEIQDLK